MTTETETGPARALPTAAYSVREFCCAHSISASFFFKLLAQGRGPAVMKVGARTLISKESAARWRAAREQETAAATSADKSTITSADKTTATTVDE